MLNQVTLRSNSATTCSNRARGVASSSLIYHEVCACRVLISFLDNTILLPSVQDVVSTAHVGDAVLQRATGRSVGRLRICRPTRARLKVHCHQRWRWPHPGVPPNFGPRLGECLSVCGEGPSSSRKVQEPAPPFFGATVLELDREVLPISGISRERFIHYSNQIPCSSKVCLCCF